MPSQKLRKKIEKEEEKKTSSAFLSLWLKSTKDEG